MKTLLIIGGTGFVGKSFLECFVKNRLKNFGVTKIIILARKVHKFKKNFPLLINKNVEILKADISNIEKLPFADLIIHAAASTEENKYLDNKKEQIIDNFRNVRNFLNIIKKKSTKNCKILFLSSGAVYGKIKEKKDSNENNEYDISKVNNLTGAKKNYAISKIYCEKLIIKKNQQLKLDIKIARLFSFIGKHIPLNTHFLIGNILNSILKKKKFLVKSNLPENTIRSYLYADDMVNLLLRILLRGKSKHKIFNVGSEERYNICQIEKIIFENFKINFNYKTNNSDYKNSDIYFPNLERVKSTFKNFHYKNLKDSIASTLKNLKNNYK
jgi:dTDP-glucose 4,6-dehydratase